MAGAAMWRAAAFTILIIVQGGALRMIAQDGGYHALSFTVPTVDSRSLRARWVNQLYQEAALWTRELNKELTDMNLTHLINNRPSPDDDPGELDHDDLLHDVTDTKDTKSIGMQVKQFALTNNVWESRRQFFDKDYYVKPDDYLDRRDRTRRMCLQVKHKCDIVLASMPRPAITLGTPLYPRRRNDVTPPGTYDQEESTSTQQINAAALDANNTRVYRRKTDYNSKDRDKHPFPGFDKLPKAQQAAMLAVMNKINNVVNTERTPEKSAYFHRRCNSLNGHCKRMYNDIW